MLLNIGSILFLSVFQRLYCYILSLQTYKQGIP